MSLFKVYPLYNMTPSEAKGCYVYDNKGKKIFRSIWWSRCNIYRSWPP